MYKEHKEDLIETLKTLEVISIDIVKGIISEINIHSEPASAFIDFFNTEKKDNKLELIKIEESGKVEIIQEEVIVGHIYQNANICNDAGMFVGKVTKVLSKHYPHKYEVETEKGKTIILETRKTKHLHHSFRVF